MNRIVPRNRTWSLRTLLPLLVCALIAAAVLPVVVIGYLVADGTATRLVGGQAELIIASVEDEVRRQVEPIEAQLASARRTVVDGQVDARDPQALRALVLGMLAATPQVYGIGLVRPDGTMRRWERGSQLEIDEPAEMLPLGRKALTAARAGDTSVWGLPFVSPVLDDAILNHRVSIEQDGELIGVMAAGLRASDLARYLDAISQRLGVTAFVLSGRERVFAYPVAARQTATGAVRRWLPCRRRPIRSCAPYGPTRARSTRHG